MKAQLHGFGDRRASSDASGICLPAAADLDYPAPEHA